MIRNEVLRGRCIVTPDGVAHMPYDVDGNGLVLVCEFVEWSNRTINAALPRRSWFALTPSLFSPFVVTCVACLASVDVVA